MKKNYHIELLTNQSMHECGHLFACRHFGGDGKVFINTNRKIADKKYREGMRSEFRVFKEPENENKTTHATRIIALAGTCAELLNIHRPDSPLSLFTLLKDDLTDNANYWSQADLTFAFDGRDHIPDSELIECAKIVFVKKEDIISMSNELVCQHLSDL